MRQTLNTFGWEQEPVFTRADRPSDAPSRRGAAPAAPFAKGAVSIAAWEHMRDAPSERDRTLSPLAKQWYADLPEEARPGQLCDRYPRIANRLALSWKDSALALLVLDSLLEDRRGRRQGFPPLVASELRQLRMRALDATDRPR